MTLVGYVRVSSESQSENYSLGAQREELMKYGVSAENIHEEIKSANDLDRPVLNKVLQGLQAGDTLVVVRMDRFARTTNSAMAAIAELETQGISFVSLDLPFCDNPLFLEFIRMVALFFARYEQASRRERQMAGIARAKLEGKYKGRKPKITEQLLKDIHERYYERRYSKIDIAKSLNISQATCYRAFQRLKEKRKGLKEGGDI